MKKICTLLMSIFILSACGEDTKSSDWWLNHPKEATEKYKECKSQGKILLIVKMLKKLPELLVEPMALCLKYLRLSQLNMISNMD
ncbi:EexN family lipoprotein (plasmid) [Klebsiella pneumoniae]|uniref:EexN family lipoprotein n=1 Tax=Klebsiella pneumoniae TaxID=573 RepID=UPI003C2B2821